MYVDINLLCAKYWFAMQHGGGNKNRKQSVWTRGEHYNIEAPSLVSAGRKPSGQDGVMAFCDLAANVRDIGLEYHTIFNFSLWYN